ncbi:MAG TPA: glycosyltransferase family 39 protein [Blastocatellia bacterium]|jgi:hypothetical protein|nr:glycosyltransferase family 39 protein [Blastocatellia bacterium]
MMALVTKPPGTTRRLYRFRRWLARAVGSRTRVRTRTKLAFALLIFLLSYATKSLQAVDLAPAMYTTDQPMGGLTETYDQRAASILEGEGLLGPYDIKPSKTVWLAQAPGYSIFLSGVYLIFGRDFYKVQLAQNALNSISPVLIFLIAGLIVSWPVGVVSGLLAAISHHLGHISNFILPDSLSALPVLAGMLLLAIAGRRFKSYLFYAGAGAAFGLAAWLRSQAMLLALVVALILSLITSRRRPVVKRAALMAAASVLAIAPITIRNYLIYGEFVPINIGVGIVLWEGIADASGDRFGAAAKDDEVARQEAILYNNARYAGTWSSPDGIRRDRDRVNKSLDIIRRHPLWYAGVMVARMREMVKYSAHAPLVYKISEAKSQQRTAPIKPGWEAMAADGSSLALGESLYWMRPALRLAQRIAKEAMLLFIIAGAVVLFAASRRRALFLSVVPVYYLLFQSFLHTEFRYTLPMQYFLFVFAALTWVLLGAVVRDAMKAAIRKRHKGRGAQAAA